LRLHHNNQALSDAQLFRLSSSLLEASIALVRPTWSTEILEVVRKDCQSLHREFG